MMQFNTASQNKYKATMKDFYDIRGYENFTRGAHTVLISTLGEFFSADVRLHFKPTSELLHYDVDISENPKRTVYHVSENDVLLISHAKVDDEIYYLGMKISGAHIADLTKIFNVTAEAVSGTLNMCVYNQFKNALAFVGDRLIVRLIAKHVSVGYYDPSKVVHMIDKFIALRSTTFEGKHFSTGLLITHSFHEYGHTGEDGRRGMLHSLNRPMDNLGSINNRFWYLADGFRTFYVTDLKSDIRSVFVYTGMYDDHFKNMVLDKTLKGGDVLFRKESGREVSIITSDAIEFVNQENCWRYRDYELLKKRITKQVVLSDNVYNALLYYVLYCSKNDISSLIWIPANIGKYKNSLKKDTINKLFRTSFNITDSSYETLVKRLLSSDGATVINTVGEVVAYGCMVDTSQARPSGVKGTGETAAGQLAKNGVAIKISQDGTIKIFLNGRDSFKF